MSTRATMPTPVPDSAAAAVTAITSAASTRTVPVAAVVVADRARKEMRGIDTLAASIDQLGLLHPIVVTPDLELVAGGRRLEAVKSLGWESVPVTVATNLTDAAAMLQAESDENAEREPLTLSEAAELARKIEDVLKPLAKDRQGKRTDLQPSAKFAGSSEPRPRDVAAKAAGVSHETIRKVRHVEEVIESETTSEPVREAAREALAEMNATGNADAGYKRTRNAETAADAVAEFPDLAYYVDKGDLTTAVRLATALRGYDEPELSMRLNNLKLTIAAEQRRDAAPAEPDGPDYVALTDAMFVAFNTALQVVSKNGGAETVRAALAGANPLQLELWRSQFERLETVAAELREATRPVLRSVK